MIILHDNYQFQFNSKTNDNPLENSKFFYDYIAQQLPISIITSQLKVHNVDYCIINKIIRAILNRIKRLAARIAVSNALTN